MSSIRIPFISLNKKVSSLFILCVSVLSFSGCATTTQNMISKQGAFNKLYEEKPKSVLVVPAINQSTAADAPLYYATTISQPLTEQGYYVLPITITDEILRSSGISDGAQLAAVPVNRLGTLFGADAVLFVTINLWDTSYYVLGGHVVVGLHYNMVSTKTSETLWQYRNQVTIDTSGNSNNAGLLGAIIETAIKTASQDYVPVAQAVNYRSLVTIPYGEYHPQFGMDGEQKVVDADKLVLTKETE